ncbi:MAG: hypothetical protein M1812_007817 [Candelaria pacifica]|nr:MAG: hypothetical protein M1812_007817 [Candelaria pacifica]
MGIGNMVFPLYVRKLPENMKFTITEIKPVDPAEGGNWYKYASTAATPFTLDTTTSAGKIGDFYLACNSTFQSGPGPSYEIRFRIDGTSPTNVSSSRTGFLTLSTTSWGTFQRPDNGLVSFVFDGSASHVLSFPTPTLTYLDDVNIVVEWLPKENALGLTVTSDKTFTKQLAEYAIGGIFKAHEKAASWAIGKVW